MQKAHEADKSAENDGMDIPKEIARRQERILPIKEAKLKIEQRAHERYEKEKKLYEEKMAKCKAKEEKTRPFTLLCHPKVEHSLIITPDSYSICRCFTLGERKLNTPGSIDSRKGSVI